MLWGLIIGAAVVALIAGVPEGRATAKVKLLTEEKARLEAHIDTQKKACEDHLKSLELALAAVPAPEVAPVEKVPVDVATGPKRDGLGRFAKATT